MERGTSPGKWDAGRFAGVPGVVLKRREDFTQRRREERKDAERREMGLGGGWGGPDAALGVWVPTAQEKFRKTVSGASGPTSVNVNCLQEAGRIAARHHFFCGSFPQTSGPPGAMWERRALLARGRSSSGTRRRPAQRKKGTLQPVLDVKASQGISRQPIAT
jgi:hypothetical protein